jgi:hypothetical protein
VSWIWNIKLRLLIGGPVLIVLGLVLYVVRGLTAALALDAIGVVLLIAGVINKPRQKTATPQVTDHR